MTLSAIATEQHVDEAMRLFLASTMDAVTQGEGPGSRELQDEVSKLEEELRVRLPVGWNTSLAKLKAQFVQGKGYSEAALSRALLVMQRRDAIQIRNGGAHVFRTGG
jgi:DNA replication licensing factor MCM5